MKDSLITFKGINLILDDVTIDKLKVNTQPMFEFSGTGNSEINGSSII